MGDDYTTHVVSDKKLPVFPPASPKMGNGDLPTIKNLGACQKIVKNSATDIFDQVFPKTKNPKKKESTFPFLDA